MRAEVIESFVTRFIPSQAYAEQWEAHSLHQEVLRVFGLDLPVEEWVQEEGIADQEIRDRLMDAVNRRM